MINVLFIMSSLTKLDRRGRASPAALAINAARAQRFPEQTLVKRIP
jgi:hypothetical protein